MVGAAMSMVSACGKKDYSCVCEDVNGAVVSQLEIKKADSKADAEEECENFETSGETCKLE